MTTADYLGQYAEGWTKGDAGAILKAVSDDYTFDDPNVGKITKSDFTTYLLSLKESVKSAQGGRLPTPFMELSEVVTHEKDGVMTAWCWWSIPGTSMKGSGLIKVGPTGVRSEVITYYAKPAT